MLALPAHYEVLGNAADYRRRFSKSPARALSNFLELRMLARALRLAGPSKRMLDIPCGTGRLVATLLGRTAQLWCVDAAAAMIGEARARAAASPRDERGPTFARASAFQLPFADDAFDVAVCWRLLQHLEDAQRRARLLAELARVTQRTIVLSFSDADTARARRIAGRERTAGRRVTISREVLAGEIRQAGLVPTRFFRLFGPFSVVGAVIVSVHDRR